LNLRSVSHAGHQGAEGGHLLLVDHLLLAGALLTLQLGPEPLVLGPQPIGLAGGFRGLTARTGHPMAYVEGLGKTYMFGGYQASLADPIAALACVKRFPDYSIWTRAMTIDFVREGNSDLELRFEFDEKLYQEIKGELQQKGRSTPIFEYALYRDDGKICSKIKNTVAIRPKNYQTEK